MIQIQLPGSLPGGRQLIKGIFMHQIRDIKGSSVIVEQQFPGGEKFGKSKKHFFFFAGFLAEPLPVNPDFIFIKNSSKKIKMRGLPG